jgi:hypothetical protein
MELQNKQVSFNDKIEIHSIELCEKKRLIIYEEEIQRLEEKYLYKKINTVRKYAKIIRKKEEELKKLKIILKGECDDILNHERLNFNNEKRALEKRLNLSEEYKKIYI